MGQWYISHQCNPGSNPRLARSGLNVVVGTPFVQFCSVAPVFLPPTRVNISKFKFDLDIDKLHENHLCGDLAFLCKYSKNFLEELQIGRRR